MALTKVRSPVSAISEMAFGTTTVEITSTAGPIDINIAGLDNLDLTTTTAVFDDLVTVTANLFQTEVVSIDTTAGASATLQTTATEAQLGTDTAHPLELYANAITALILATDGKVGLQVEGTAIGDLVTKAYVDTADALNATLADITATTAVTGSISIPNSTGNSCHS